MRGPPAVDPRPLTHGLATRPRWPGVIGTIGIILGALILIDKVDDLLTLAWTEEQWRRIFAPDIAAVIVRAMPPVGWRLVFAVTQMGVGVLLVVGSVALLRHRRLGVKVCRAWAGLAIAWAVLFVGWGSWWMRQYGGEIAGVSRVSWQAYAVFGMAVALGLMLAYPGFLLFWLSRPEVRAEWEEWP